MFRCDKCVEFCNQCDSEIGSSRIKGVINISWNTTFVEIILSQSSLKDGFKDLCQPNHFLVKVLQKSVSISA